jgi:TIR domain
MTALGQFDFDLFISYGWAGSTSNDDDRGDRGWVKEFKSQLESQLSGALGRRARIFLDVEQPQNGELPANLKFAVSSSALFLSVISPGSCKQGSWCHFELEAFLAAAVLPHSGQLLSILMRDVLRDRWPEPLRKIVPREFLSDKVPRLTLPKEELGRMDTQTGRLVQELALDMSKALEALERQIARTVFVATVPPGLAGRAERLTIEIDRRGGAVFQNSIKPDASEADFRERTRRALRRCGLSVHLLPENAVPVPPGWSDAPQGLQVGEAAARFGSESNRMTLWREGEQVTGIEAAATSRAQVLQGTGFEDFEYLVRDSLRSSVALRKSRTEASMEQAVAKDAGGVGATRAAGPQFVYVECVRQDLPKLVRLRELLEQKGIRIQAPLFEGDETLLRRTNEEFLKNDNFQRRCRAVAVYFGSRNDLEAFVACRLLDDALHDRRPDLPKAILLDPYDDPVHSFFSYPNFEAFPSSRLEDFVQQMLGSN